LVLHTRRLVDLASVAQGTMKLLASALISAVVVTEASVAAAAIVGQTVVLVASAVIGAVTYWALTRYVVRVGEAAAVVDITRWWSRS